MSYIKYPFEVKELPYSYNGLEPILSGETMYYHHDKHYKTYVEWEHAYYLDYRNVKKDYVNRWVNSFIELKKKLYSRYN